ncbi:hypothetical protein [Loktanella sp. Alg231-35]|uniref:hypothetical protein n=1 Tax=Loktanella sp. Alg231-35 TaxID=1922220 RepID=UPI000D553512|nr:hypothetical protein [Loktanella sp. Alg231-35]
MTALDKYVRLESDALWRASPDAQRRDVTISFGDATLVIADGAGRPLTHWSLPALIRQNTGETPAIYAPDDAASEVLEIADPTMIDAIEEVRKALAKTRPHPGKLRHWLTGATTLLVAALAIFWLPGALTRQTLAVVPAPKRVEIGATILGHMQSTTGVPCRAAMAEQAAGNLATRLFGADTMAQIIVLPQLAAGSIALPGGLIVLDGQMLAQASDPAAAAGFVLAARAAVDGDDPMQSLLEGAGLGVTFRLLTTGEVPQDILQNVASDFVATDPQSVDPDTLRALMAAAQVPHAPYLNAVDQRTGSMPDLGADPINGTTVPLILNDSEWVALQNICNN